MAPLDARQAILDLNYFGVSTSRFPLPCGCTDAQQERATHAWDCPAVVRAGRTYRKVYAFPHLYGRDRTPKERRAWARWVNEGGVAPSERPQRRVCTCNVKSQAREDHTFDCPYRS